MKDRTSDQPHTVIRINSRLTITIITHRSRRNQARRTCHYTSHAPSPGTSHPSTQFHRSVSSQQSMEPHQRSAPTEQRTRARQSQPSKPTRTSNESKQRSVGTGGGYAGTTYCTQGRIANDPLAAKGLDVPHTKWWRNATLLGWIDAVDSSYLI